MHHKALEFLVNCNRTPTKVVAPDLPPAWSPVSIWYSGVLDPDGKPRETDPVRFEFQPLWHGSSDQEPPTASKVPLASPATGARGCRRG